MSTSFRYLKLKLYIKLLNSLISLFVPLLDWKKFLALFSRVNGWIISRFLLKHWTTCNHKLTEKYFKYCRPRDEIRDPTCFEFRKNVVNIRTTCYDLVFFSGRVKQVFSRLSPATGSYFDPYILLPSSLIAVENESGLLFAVAVLKY